jgi:APA family basic amino acid/polyamine antiporter
VVSGERIAVSSLPRILTLRDLTLLLIGSVIGSGIFLVPGVALKQVDGSVGLALGAWVAGGVIMLLGALTMAELGSSRPAAGGQYVFLRECYGPLPAFLFGWTVFFVTHAGGVAALSVAFTETLRRLVAIDPLTEKLLAVGVIAALAVVNARGTRHGANVQNTTTAVKVGAILLMSLVLLALGRSLGDAAASVPPAPSTAAPLSAFGVALIGVLWAYHGWQQVVFSAGETVHPQRTFPRAFLLGSLALVSVYLLANFGYLAALGPSGLSTTDSAAPASLGAVLGGWAAALVTLVIMVSVFGAANSNFMTNPRVFFAMANDGVFFRKLGDVHPRFGTPAFAILASAPFAAVLAATGTFEQLLTYVVVVSLVFDVLAVLCIFILRKRTPEAERPYSVPGYPWTPILFILAAVAVMVNTLTAKPLEALIGLGLVALGIPAFFVWRARLKPVPTADTS